MTLLAALPIVVVLVLMLGARWSAAGAGLAGLAIAIALAVAVFPPADIGAAAAAVGISAEAGFIAFTILWIIGPALAIHHLQLRSGATEVLRAGLARLTGDPRLTALLVAWFFALFIEGAAGFGTAVALAAPFLVAMGFAPLTAVVAAMIGHAVGVSFGAVGTPIVPQIAATGMTGQELAGATATYHGLLGLILLIAVMVVVDRSLPDRDPVAWVWTIGAGVAFLVPYTVIARSVGPELPTLGGALIGAAVFVAVLIACRGREPATSPPATGMARPLDGAALLPSPADVALPTSTAGLPPTKGALVRAAAPYLALVGLVLVTRLLPPVRETLQGVTISWQLPGGFTGSLSPLYHPGSMLLAGLLFGALVQRTDLGTLRGAMAAAARMLVPVGVALVAMLGLSRVMVHASMVDTLARGAAAAAGAGWPLFAPLVGVLGTFVTGSATASNILFTDFQQATAQQLDLPVLPVVGAQGFGAAIGNAVCPHNIVAASATVSLTGQEGDVLRRTIGITLGYAAAGGALAWMFVVRGVG